MNIKSFLADKKVGIALGSGGGRGLIHLGVLKCLEEYGIKVSFISGSSIGALIGGLYSSGLKFEDMYEKIFHNKSKVLKTLLDPSMKSGIVKGVKVENLISSWLVEDNYSALNIPFAAVATDLKSGNIVIFKEGNLSRTILASMSVPFLFKPVKIGDYLLVDGGISNPVPDDVVKKMGANFIISVNLDSRIDVEDNNDYRWSMSILKRSFNVARHYLAEKSMRDSDIVISPSFSKNSTLGLDNFLDDEKSHALIDRGYSLLKKELENFRL